MKRVGEIALIGWLAGTQLLAAGATAPNSFLLEAIRNGDIKAVRRSIQKSIEINTRDDRGNTALHLAALNLDVDTVARLLKAGGNPNATNIWGDTPLIYSASSLEKVQLLLHNGADINGRATNGTTVLSAAGAFRNSYRAVQFLLDHGAKPDPKQPVEIRNAVLGGDVETVKLLLAHGAIAKSDSDDHMDSPLVLAVAFDRELIAQLLVKGSGPPKASMGLLNTTFHWAGFGQKGSVARSSVLSGADVHEPFRQKNFLGSPRMDGTLPLHWA